MIEPAVHRRNILRVGRKPSNFIGQILKPINWPIATDDGQLINKRKNRQSQFPHDFAALRSA